MSFRWYLVAIVLLIGEGVYAQSLVGVDSSALSMIIDDIVVTAVYEPTHYKNALHKIEVINNQQMTQRGALTLDQALTLSPAVRLSVDPILGTSIRMRDIGGNNVAILRDGIPVIGRLGGNIDLSQIGLHNIERIEIVQGALSNIYGSNAAGGVINLISKKSQLNKWSIDIGSQIESIGKQRFNTSLGYKMNDLQLKINGSYLNYNQYPTDSLRIYEKFELPSGNKIEQSKYPFNPKTQITAEAQAQYFIDETSAVSVQYDYNDEKVSDYGKLRRPKYKPYANDNAYYTSRSDVSLKYKKEWKNIFLEVITARNLYDRSVERNRYYIETDSFDTKLRTVDTTHFTSYFNKAFASYKINKKLKIVGGINHALDTGRGDRIKNNTSQDSTTARFYEVSPFIEFKINPINNLDISVSGRFINHSLYDSKITPAVQLKYAINDKIHTRIGYAQGYRNPSLKELFMEFIDINHYIIGNPNLKPETSHDIQATFDYEPVKDLNLSINAYRTKIQDKISITQFEDKKNRYDNVSRYGVLGIQPSVNYSFKKLKIESSMSINYWETYIDHNDAPQYGNMINLNNSISYSINRYRLFVNHRHTGKRPSYFLVDEEVQLSTFASYDMIDFSVSKKLFGNRLDVTVGIQNLLNIKTASIGGASISSAHSSVGRSLISQGISGFLTVNYRPL